MVASGDGYLEASAAQLPSGRQISRQRRLEQQQDSAGRHVRLRLAADPVDERASVRTSLPGAGRAPVRELRAFAR